MNIITCPRCNWTTKRKSVYTHSIVNCRRCGNHGEYVGHRWSWHYTKPISRRAIKTIFALANDEVYVSMPKDLQHEIESFGFDFQIARFHNEPSQYYPLNYYEWRKRAIKLGYLKGKVYV